MTRGTFFFTNLPVWTCSSENGIYTYIRNRCEAVLLNRLLQLLAFWRISHVVCRLLHVFTISIFSEHYQSVKRFRSRAEPIFCFLSVLIWVRTICKDYQQLSKVAATWKS